MDDGKKRGRIVLTVEFDHGLMIVCRRMGHVPRGDGTNAWVNERLGAITVTVATDAQTVSDYLLSWALTYGADGVTRSLETYARKHEIALPDGIPIVDPML